MNANAKNLVEAPPYARTLTVIDGVTLGEVVDTIQDSNGYLWLGTMEGLIRFDGTKIKRYRHNSEDPHSLSHNVINGLVQDNQGNIWVATFGGGLNRFEPLTETFTRVDIANNGMNPDTDKLYELTIDRQNVLWIGTTKGIVAYDLNNEKVSPLTGPLADLPKTIVFETLIDNSGDYWFATYRNGLFHFDGKTLQHYTHDINDPDSLTSDGLRTLFQDESGALWIATNKGLNRFNRKTATFERFVPSDDPRFEAIENDIFAIESDDRGRLWLGTVLSGIMRFDYKRKRFTPISGNKHINHPYKSARVNHILKDNKGSLWFATAQGLMMVPKLALNIDFLGSKDGTAKISELKQLSDSEVAVMVDFKYHILNLQRLTTEAKLTEIVHAYRVKLLSDGQQWIATLSQSLQKVGTDLDNFTLQPSHAYQGEQPFPISIYDLFFDNAGFLWLYPLSSAKVYKGGLLRVDPNTLKFDIIATEPPFEDHLALDDERYLLTSGAKGLFELNTRTLKLTPFMPLAENRPERVMALYRDSRGNLWFGTEGSGIAMLAPDKNRFEYFTTENGLLSNGILSIIEDNRQNLWLGTPVGLSSININSHQVQSFESQDGLLFNKFHRRSASKLSDGRIMMGTFNGVMLFEPDKLRLDNHIDKVVFQDLQRLNQPVAIRAKDPDSPLLKPLAFSEHLTLSYEDYVFAFNFSAVELLRPDKVEYAYQMAGLSDDWLFTGAQNNIASYTTLPARDYVFKVKARKNNGPWSETPASIKLTITPPWWLSRWAIAAYVILTMLSIYAYIRLRTHRLQARSKELEVSVAKRTAELKASRDELAEKSQTVSQLLAQKQRLFASISHEFRTPLTLILSPIENLLSKEPDNPWSKAMLPVKHNGQRLLRMVEQLLEFAKLEQATPQSHEIVSLQQTLTIIGESFDTLMQSKGIRFEVNTFDDVNLRVLPDSLNKILINLLSNAFKYTPENGSIKVSISPGDKQVTVVIEDNGIGISKEDLPVIFERFRRASGEHTQSVPGAGIGLSLVKELIEANDGKIQVTSEIGKGTRFTLSLPITEEKTQGLKTQDSQVVGLEIENAVYQDAAANLPDENAHIDNPEESALKTLLVVEDNADMRALLFNLLHNDYQIMTAANGQQGLELALKHLPDLVLSDVMMPVLDGYQMAEQLKENPLTSHIPLILLTAKGSIENRLKGLQLLVDDYLSKPFHAEELTQRIHNLLSIRENLSRHFAETLAQDPMAVTRPHSGINKPDQQFIDRVYQQLEQHYQDPQFNLEMLHQALLVSERQLQRKLKALFDMSVPELIRNYRLNKAVELLAEGRRVSDIYLEIGFSSHSYFSSCFKSKYGQPPKVYQQSLNPQEMD